MGGPPGNCHNPNGRPRKEINWELFEELCGLQCTQSELASCLKIDEDTLRSRVKDHYGEDYSVVYKRYAEDGKCSLRRYQFVQARTNATMAIWLGKQYLDQKDSNDNPPTAGDYKLVINPDLGSGSRLSAERLPEEDYSCSELRN